VFFVYAVGVGPSGGARLSVRLQGLCIFSGACSGVKNLSSIGANRCDILEDIMMKYLVTMLALLSRYPLVATWIRRILNVLLCVFENCVSQCPSGPAPMLQGV